jgi:hypothetical protein
LILTVSVETFLTINFLTYSPPGSHLPACHDKTSMQSTPNLRPRSPRDIAKGFSVIIDIVGDADGPRVCGLEDDIFGLDTGLIPGFI